MVVHQKLSVNASVGRNRYPQIWPRAEFCVLDTYQRRHPIRIYSDAAAEGGLASLTYCPDLGPPLSLQAQVEQAVGLVASTINKVYLFELSWQ